ncbi:MAG TPA: ABC transporter permease subunit [Methylomirabilota bacterium]|nr:ABC transporter permease subunit [Methylomirabilota bacterium]
MPSRDALEATRAPLRPLLAKELRDLLAGRAFWVMTLILCPVVGYGFIQAVRLYSEASKPAMAFPELARGLSSLDGVLVPTFGAFYVAVTLLFPFVAIRSLGAEKQNGGLKLLLQFPYRPAVLVGAKFAAVLVGWLVALVPAVSAVIVWTALGGYVGGRELLTLLLGHLLYGILIAAVGLCAAALTDGPATAAIATLAVTLGAWVLDFMAVGPDAWSHAVASLSPTTGLRTFEGGLLSLPAALGMLIGAMTLLALTTVWLSPGRSVKQGAPLSVGAVVGGIVLALVASRATVYADVTEDRRNSFAPADEAALRHVTAPLTLTVYLAPDDPRLADFNRQVLSKLRRLVPKLSVVVAEPPRGLFLPAGGDRYGLVVYDYGGKREESRSTSPREVLPLLYGLAGVTVGASEKPDYPGHPLVSDSRAAAGWFYVALPLLVGLGWRWVGRRSTGSAELESGGYAL